MNFSDIPHERIAFVGDWHCNITWAKDTMNALAGHADVIVHCGDFGYWPRLPQGKDFLNAVQSRARERNCDLPVLFVDGNHEDHELLREHRSVDDAPEPVELRERVWWLPRGTQWSWDGVDFLALGGAASVDREVRTQGYDWFPEEELTLGDLEWCRGAKADVMVTHDTVPFTDSYRVPRIPPDSAWSKEAMQRSRGHQQLIGAAVDEVQPTHLFHGHFHSRYYYEMQKPWGNMLITGLDCDRSSFTANTLVTTVDELRQDVKTRRSKL